MTGATETHRNGTGPIQGLLLAFPIALFSAALASDIAYVRTAEIQWTNFSAWLITGALVFGGLVLAWALIELLIKRGRALYVLLLALMFLAGLVNAFQHSRDGWSSVGGLGLTLSVVSSVLAMAAGWLAYSRSVRREVVR